MVIAETDEEILSCFEVHNQLRSDLELPGYLQKIRIMQSQGFLLAYLKEKDQVVTVAGFRVYLDLSVNGNALYVYDLVTAVTHRSKGFGEAMLKDLKAYARKENCQCIHLDSNTTRHQAHKFYLQNGLHISAYHFLELFDDK